MAEDLPRSGEVFPTVGYELLAYDGGLNPIGDYCGDFWPPPAPHCRKCQSLLDFEYFSRNVQIRGNRDIADADGRTIVNERFRDFSIRNGSQERDFRLVNEKRRLFELWPQRVLGVDFHRSEPRLEQFCTKCGNFGCYMFGRGLFLINVAEPLSDGFYRTDLVFGCGMGKNPCIIAAPETMRKIKAARFRRASFRPVPYIDPDFEKFQKTLEALKEYQRARDRATMAKGPKKNGA